MLGFETAMKQHLIERSALDLYYWEFLWGSGVGAGCGNSGLWCFLKVCVSWIAGVQAQLRVRFPGLEMRISGFLSPAHMRAVSLFGDLLAGWDL